MALRLGVAVFVLLFLTLQVTDAWNDFCQSSEIIGVWNLRRDQSVTDDYKDCSSVGYNTLTHRVTLRYPNIAIDEYGNYGTWTIIYGIGLEITVHGRKYFTYFEVKYDWRNGWKADCGSTLPGSSRDILTNNYACFQATKGSRLENETEKEGDHKLKSGDEPSSPHPPTFKRDDPPIPTDVPTYDDPPVPTDIPREERRSRKVGIDYELIDRINSNDIRLWKAEAYDHLKDLTEDQLIMMCGGNMSTRGRPAKPAPMTKDQLLKMEYFPRSFDWRDVDGENYVSPVRNQGYCGSCYAFAATAAYEARIRIMTKNTIAPILSPQDVVDCSPYSYGCGGGWIYPEGRYAEEFGFVDETCSSYNGEESYTCNRDKNCLKYYATNYRYVGGYFGAGNEYEIMNALLNNGPVVVGYAVYQDFIFYRSGIYYHSGPDYLMGYHAVSIIGWGKDDRSGTKYWIVKNSWGSNWGEKGFFRIVRGNNDCDIEGEAFEAFPII